MDHSTYPEIDTPTARQFIVTAFQRRNEFTGRSTDASSAIRAQPLARRCAGPSTDAQPFQFTSAVRGAASHRCRPMRAWDVPPA
jgi:hypothetical protein